MLCCVVESLHEVLHAFHLASLVTLVACLRAARTWYMHGSIKATLRGRRHGSCDGGNHLLFPCFLALLLTSLAQLAVGGRLSDGV